MGLVVMQALAASMPIMFVCLCILDRNMTPAAYFTPTGVPVGFEQLDDHF